MSLKKAHKLLNDFVEYKQKTGRSIGGFLTEQNNKHLRLMVSEVDNIRTTKWGKLPKTQFDLAIPLKWLRRHLYYYDIAMGNDLVGLSDFHYSHDLPDELTFWGSSVHWSQDVDEDEDFYALSHNAKNSVTPNLVRTVVDADLLGTKLGRNIITDNLSLALTQQIIRELEQVCIPVVPEHTNRNEVISKRDLYGVLSEVGLNKNVILIMRPETLFAFGQQRGCEKWKV